ncbi:hypothetical protein PHMEG_000412 [Phytophthora megakarya]|uniref:Uncharacterized protein n=1 Tax=Phytophthora megakarya TaxID=4795 RepID=A0A225X4D7_9STRA|nr:hypothetical protein PHMEG_000412 [Phytophthora megakarya]
MSVVARPSSDDRMLRASHKSPEASRAAMANNLFSERCTRANAETWTKPFSADRDAAHKEIKIVKSREAALNSQISKMNAVIKSHQEMYDHLKNRMQVAHRSNDILSKEENHARSEYLVRFQAFKKYHDNLHKLLPLTETTLTLKLRERNRDLVRRVKRLEKANSALGSRLRLEDMDPEVLVLMVEGLELDKIDWETVAPDPQTRRALHAVYKLGLSDGRDRDSLADDIARAKIPALLRPQVQHRVSRSGSARAVAVFLTVALHYADWTSSRRHWRWTYFKFCAVFGHTCWTVSAVDCLFSSLAACLGASRSTSFRREEGKSKAKRQRTASDNKDVDFGGGDSGEDTPEKGPAHDKTGSTHKKIDVAVSDAESMLSPRLTLKRKAAMNPEFRSSFRLAGGSRSDIKSLTSESSAGQSVKSPPSKSKRSRSKKNGTKATPGYSSSDESSESKSSSDLDSLASEGSVAHEDEDSELSKPRPESQCLENSLDDVLGAPAPTNPLVKNLRAEEAPPKPKVKPLPVAKADSKSSPKGKKKASPKSSGKKKLAMKAKKAMAPKMKSKSSPKTSRPSKKVKSQDFADESSFDFDLPDWISKYPELVKLAQRASDVLTPYVAPDFTTVSAQMYWQVYGRRPPLAEGDVQVACLFDTTEFQLDSNISQRTDYLERLCGVWRRLRGYGNEKLAVMSFAIYECKHWVSPEAVKRFLSRMTTQLESTKDPKEHRRFKLALEHLKKVWLKYNKERADRANNLRTFLPGRMWSWCVGPDASLPIETLLDPTLPFYTMENLMWVPGSADSTTRCMFRATLTCRSSFLPARLSKSSVHASPPDLSLEPEDIDSSWGRAFRGADEDEGMEDGETGPHYEAAEAPLILLFAKSSLPPESGVVAEI